jgi:hypothetical protein
MLHALPTPGLLRLDESYSTGQALRKVRSERSRTVCVQVTGPRAHGLNLIRALREAGGCQVYAWSDASPGDPAHCDAVEAAARAAGATAFYHADDNQLLFETLASQTPGSVSRLERDAHANTASPTAYPGESTPRGESWLGESPGYSAN